MNEKRAQISSAEASSLAAAKGYDSAANLTVPLAAPVSGSGRDNGRQRGRGTEKGVGGRQVPTER